MRLVGYSNCYLGSVLSVFCSCVIEDLILNWVVSLVVCFGLVVISGNLLVGVDSVIGVLVVICIIWLVVLM